MNIMKIFLYGFRAYGKYKDNITEKIIQRLVPRSTVITKVFPVMFDQKQFLESLQEIEPDIILGLGQCRKGDKIRIEQQAKNIQQDGHEAPQKPIIPGKNKFLPVTLHLKPTEKSVLSFDAKNFVCNFSMYVILNAIKNRNIPYAFLHIPHSFDLDQATTFVEMTIDQILQSKKSEFC